MTLNEIIKKTATIIGREDLSKYIDGDESQKFEDTESTVDMLKNLAVLVIKELAATYIPMYKKESVTSQNGKVFYADLSQTAVEIIGVYDNDGNKIDCTFSHEYFEVGQKQVIVEYEMVPPNYNLGENVGYSEKQVAPIILSYGLAAEYYVSTGRFEQAVMWHKRYTDAINSMRKIKNVNIKNRCFV